MRAAIGRMLVGDRANHAWGVMDVLASRDFPDIRFKSSIRSERGSILLIPREGGYLVRLYVDLRPVTLDNRDAIRAMDGAAIAAIADIARQVLPTCTLEIRETVWSAVYEVRSVHGRRRGGFAPAGCDLRTQRSDQPGADLTSVRMGGRRMGQYSVMS